MDTKKRKARPERIRVALWDDASGSLPLDLPDRRSWPAGLLFLAMFAIFAGIAWVSVVKARSHAVQGVFDLMVVLFEGFWVLGWSVGVVILGGLAFLFLFYGESARLQGGRLVHVPRLGPLKILVEYDLARVHNLRLETAGSGDTVRIRFDYGEGSSGLGDSMPRSEAERLVELIAGAGASRIGAAAEPATASPARRPSLAEHALPPHVPASPPPSLTSPSSLVLVGANLLPLAGVVFWGWSTAEVVVLYWAESAVIAFYTVLKIIIVAKLGAIFAVPFFVGHFGAFMAIHFLFINELFVRGIDARGPDLAAREALFAIFVPVWPVLAALFLSHGVSFFANFLARREHAGATASALMSAPYQRIVLMQVTLIFGGWIVMSLKSPVPALVVLVLLKIAADVTAHRKEHGKTRAAQVAR